MLNGGADINAQLDWNDDPAGHPDLSALVQDLSRVFRIVQVRRGTKVVAAASNVSAPTESCSQVETEAER